MNNINVNRNDAGGSGSETDRFLSDPAEFFSYSRRKAHSLERDQLEALQLAALRKRFESLRDRIATLKKMADDQRISEVKTLEDIVPLLFRHTVYKSYPASLLEKNRFKQLTQWLGKLTTVDLSQADVAECEGIDDWIDALDRTTAIRVRHSSGTTGTMSFMGRTDAEADRAFRNIMYGNFEMVGDQPAPRPNAPLSMHVVVPNFRGGRTGMLRSNEYYFKYMAGGDEAKFHTLYPTRQSSDLMYLAGRIAAAKANGELERLELSPSLVARKGDFEKLQSNMAHDMDVFFSDIIKNLKGETVYTFGTWNLLYNLATKGLAEGVENVFSSNSIITTGGGAKGQVVPPDWQDKVKKFFGISKIINGYGMTELTSGYKMCDHGRYHLEPAIIVFQLDPDTGETLPRSGVQTGRAAFFDLLPDTYWGGFISGDEITIDWSTPCPCGLKSAHMSSKIERYSAMRGGDDKISCAASNEAHDDALNFLNEFTS